MGFSTRAVLAIGKDFDYKEDMFEFLKTHKLITAEQLKLLNDSEDWECDLYEFIDTTIALPDFECLNYYTDEEYYVGYKLSVHNIITNPEKFAKDVSAATDKWKALFSSEPSVIHRVIRS